MYQTTFNDTPQLEDIFLKTKRPYWTAYSIPKLPLSRSVQPFAVQSEDIDLSESWGILEELVEGQLSRGNVVIIRAYQSTDKKNNPVEWSIGEEQVSQYPRHASRINGFPGQQAPRERGMSATEVQKMIDAEREKWEMKRELEDLRDELEYVRNEKASNSDIAVIGGVPVSTKTIDGLLNGIMQKYLFDNKGPATQVAVNGLPQGQAQQGNAANAPSEDMPSEEDVDKAFDQVAKAINGNGPDVMKLLIRIGNFAEQNPAMFHQVLSMLP